MIHSMVFSVAHSVSLLKAFWTFINMFLSRVCEILKNCECTSKTWLLCWAVFICW